MKKIDELNKRLLVVLGLSPETAQLVMDRITEAEAETERLRAAIKLADEMHLGRCASSEPFTAQDYRNHACEARNILRSASANTQSSTTPKHGHE